MVSWQPTHTYLWGRKWFTFHRHGHAERLWSCQQKRLSSSVSVHTRWRKMVCRKSGWSSWTGDRTQMRLRIQQTKVDLRLRHRWGSLLCQWFRRRHEESAWKRKRIETSNCNIYDGLMVAFITCNSSLVPLLEGLCSSNPCRFEVSDFLSFCRNRTDDLGINSPTLWPTELVLHRLGHVCRCTLLLIDCFGTELVLCNLYLMKFDLTKGLLFDTFFNTVLYKFCLCDQWVLGCESFSLPMNW